MSAPLPFPRLLDEIRARISEEAPLTFDSHLSATPGAQVIDLREADELAAGMLPAATHLPRGVLELRIGQLAPDPATPLFLYCAGGTRSALAAHTLQQLGYTHVVSLAGGFGAWKEAGLPFTLPVEEGLSDAQRERYARHLVIPEVGESGQARLLEARVLLLGAGGLGSPAALYLAAAGVGTLGLIDSDRVDRSNLQRQILHTDQRVGMEKVSSARATIEALNPEVRVEAMAERLTEENIEAVLGRGWDVIVDGGDTFRTRYLLNEVTQRTGHAVVHASVYRFDGQLTTFLPGQGPCYACLYPEAPPAEFAPSCQEAGVLGVLPGIMGTLQALEALKVILKLGETLNGRLLRFDAKTSRFKEIRVMRDPACAICGTR